MNKEEKQAVKNSNKYCFLTNSCPDTQKPMYLLSSYKCCNQCNNKRCTARCCDKYEDCRLSTTKQELLEVCPNIRLSEESVRLFPRREVGSPTNQGKPIDKNHSIKPVASLSSPIASGTTSETDKNEAKNSTPENNPTVETTLTVSQIAKMLNVSYDRVAYLIREKKLTQQQAIDRLKEKK